MIQIDEFAGKHIAVLGLGRTGLAAAKALRAGGAHVLAWDDGQVGRDAAQALNIPLCDLSRRDLSDLGALVLSPGIAHTLPNPHRIVALAKACSIPIISDIEIFARALARFPKARRPKLVGITGTNGKSTTTVLLTHILQQAHIDAHCGGNIGRACLDLPAFRSGQVHVLELSSYQLELTRSLHCDAAVLLNISPDHLERHGDMENYQNAKAHIFTNQTDQDIAIFGVDDPCSMSMLSEQNTNPVQTCAISVNGALSHGIYVVGGQLMDARDGPVTQIADLRRAQGLRGAHNWQNAAAAYAIARHLGVASKTIISALYSFGGLAHRMENLGQIGSVQVVNDSKATNADAATRALASFSNIYWIAGGQAKEDDLTSVLPFLDRVQHTYLIGQDGPKMAKTLKEHGQTHICKTLNRAFAAAIKDAKASEKPDPVLLFSPACASFDQFTDFEARGDAFRALFQNSTNEARE